MENVNIFEMASRTKIRFPFRGAISVEDLWDLPVESLDSIYSKLSAARKSAGESLLAPKNETNTELDLQIDIIKHIVSVKLAELDARKNAAERKAKEAEILAVIAEKQGDALKSKSIEELKEMLSKL